MIIQAIEVIVKDIPKDNSSIWLVATTILGVILGFIFNFLTIDRQRRVQYKDEKLKAMARILIVYKSNVLYEEHPRLRYVALQSSFEKVYSTLQEEYIYLPLESAKQLDKYMQNVSEVLYDGFNYEEDEIEFYHLQDKILTDIQKEIEEEYQKEINNLRRERS